MTDLASLLAVESLSPESGPENPAAAQLSALLGMHVYPRSVAAADGVVYCLARDGIEKHLALVAERELSDLDALPGEDRVGSYEGEPGLYVRLCPTDPAHAAALAGRLAFLRPALAGVRPTIGCGDRLGLATPAHVRAVRGAGVFPVLAQQSMREMARSGRAPADVLADAQWGVFQEGWRDGFGSDADHLKTPADVDVCAAAGFTMFTVDPGDHVDPADADLPARYAALPWDALESTPDDCRRAYADRRFDLGGGDAVAFGPADLLHAAVKYGRAVAHTAAMHRHVGATMAGRPFELEMSIDETAEPTSPAEHYFVAAELRRLGVRCVSLAPRFIGEFEKGVGYRGELDTFRRAFRLHVAIARALGPYKISLHSGSDKFSIYPIVAELAGDLVHLKTAGTSYLEALRAVARVDAPLFREVFAFARGRYDEDRATYHVSADVADAPSADALRDDELPALLDGDGVRQVLHVTFGSVLTARDGAAPRYRRRLLDCLREHEEVHYDVLAAHMRRHVEPIAP